MKVNSASARISKGQGYRGKKMAGSSFGQKSAICIVARKKLEKMLCFPISFNTFKTL
jgi:hypothetical protein